MRATAALLALLGTSCDLANPCTPGAGSFDLYFVGDMEGSGWLETSAVPRIGGEPARLTAYGAARMTGPGGAPHPEAGEGELKLMTATCARKDSTARLVATLLAPGEDTGGAQRVAILDLRLAVQPGGWGGDWAVTADDGERFVGRVVAAAR